MLQLRAIQYIVAVSQYGSVHKAAAKMYVSQPAITNCIKTLENEFGIQLFIRQKQRMVLTPAGQFFVNEGEKILQMIDGFSNNLLSFAGSNSKAINVGMSPFYGKYFFPQLYKTFHADSPAVKINLHTEHGNESLPLLLDGSLDFWFTGESIESPKLNTIDLMPEQIVLLYPKKLINPLICPDLAQKNNGDSVDLSYFRSMSFIAYENEHGLYPIIKRRFENEKISPTVIFQTSSAEIIAGMVSSEIGYGFVPETLAISICNGNDRIGYFSMDIFHSFRLLYCKDAHLTPAQLSFINAVEEYFCP